MENVLIIYERDNVYVGSFKKENTFYLDNSQSIKEQIYFYVSKEEPTIFLLDMTGVTHFDSSTIGCLVASIRTAKKHRNFFILCCLTDRMKDIIKVMHLDKVFTMYETVEEYFEI